MPEAYADSYEVVIQIHLDGDQWGAVVGPDPISGVAGFGYTVNEVMAKSSLRWSAIIGIGKNSPSRIRSRDQSHSRNRSTVQSELWQTVPCDRHSLR